jgi:hypothetical protein
MTTCWKDNFKHSAMELLFSTYSVLEVEEKRVEDEPAIKGQHGRRRRWDEKHLGSRLVAKGKH